MKIYLIYKTNGLQENLSTLNKKRVYVLTSGGTASSSELLINALRGIDVEPANHQAFLKGQRERHAEDAVFSRSGRRQGHGISYLRLLRW